MAGEFVSYQWSPLYFDENNDVSVDLCFLKHFCVSVLSDLLIQNILFCFTLVYEYLLKKTLRRGIGL